MPLPRLQYGEIFRGHSLRRQDESAARQAINDRMRHHTSRDIRSTTLSGVEFNKGDGQVKRRDRRDNRERAPDLYPGIRIDLLHRVERALAEQGLGNTPSESGAVSNKPARGRGRLRFYKRVSTLT